MSLKDSVFVGEAGGLFLYIILEKPHSSGLIGHLIHHSGNDAHASCYLKLLGYIKEQAACLCEGYHSCGGS